MGIERGGVGRGSSEHGDVAIIMLNIDIENEEQMRTFRREVRERQGGGRRGGSDIERGGERKGGMGE